MNYEIKIIQRNIGFLLCAIAKVCNLLYYNKKIKQTNEQKMKPFFFSYRPLEKRFSLVEAQLSLPTEYVSKLCYKYIVWKKEEKKEGGRYEWEHLLGFGFKCNRCLQIPRSRCKSGGICNSKYMFVNALWES